MKTYIAKESEVAAGRKWYVVDAQDQILGRMSSRIASLLRGKNKAYFSPHQDTGDFVIVVNADKVRVTGQKLKQKTYYKHSGYPGGQKSTTLEMMMQKHPGRAVELAVKRMLPKNALGRRMFRKLKVYSGPDHPHRAQNPEVLQLS